MPCCLVKRLVTRYPSPLSSCLLSYHCGIWTLTLTAKAGKISWSSPLRDPKIESVSIGIFLEMSNGHFALQFLSFGPISGHSAVIQRSFIKKITNTVYHNTESRQKTKQPWRRSNRDASIPTMIPHPTAITTAATSQQCGSSVSPPTMPFLHDVIHNKDTITMGHRRRRHFMLPTRSTCDRNRRGPTNESVD